MKSQVDIRTEPESKRQAFMNLNILLGMPQNLYKERQPMNGFGWGGNLLFEVKKPVYVGLDATWQKYDSESDTYLQIDGDGFQYLEEEETSNQILGLNGLFRVQPELDFFIRPYVDGMVGYTLFYTRTALTDLDLNESINSYGNHTDWTLTYGGALGFQINLSRDLIFIDLKCAYVLGSNAEFYSRIPGANFAISVNNFELRNAPVSMIMPQIGVTFLLTNENKERNEEYEEEF